MRRIRPFHLFFVLVCSIPFLPCSTGCGPNGFLGTGLFPTTQRSTDRDKVSDLEGQYNVAMEIILFAGQQGWIPDNTLFNVIEPARASANNAINYLKGEVAAGRPIDGSTYLRAAEGALTTLSQYQVQFEPQVKAAKTAPLKKTTKASATPVVTPVAPAPAPDVPQPLPETGNGPGNNLGGGNGDLDPNSYPG